MQIQEVKKQDLEEIQRFVGQVSEVDVLPNFSEQGKTEYRARVLPDIVTTFDASRFQIRKAVLADKIIGFGALRDGNYLTHLFVLQSVQGQGLGKKILDVLLRTTASKEISLRSSVNAVGFYQSYGFKVTGREADFNGIRFVPMSLNR